MRELTCPQCGRAYELVDDVQAFVRQQTGTVRPADVAAHFGISSNRATLVLTRLVERGLLCRVRYGHYTADMELARRMLLERLERLTPA